MSTRAVLYRRRFLNRPRHHLGAHVIAEVDVERPDSGAPYVDARLHLSDCSRHITLDFSAYLSSGIGNRPRRYSAGSSSS